MICSFFEIAENGAIILHSQEFSICGITTKLVGNQGVKTYPESDYEIAKMLAKRHSCRISPVHGTGIFSFNFLKNQREKYHQLAECDAIITQSDAALICSTGDCPIICIEAIGDLFSTVKAIVHSGYAGTIKKILPLTIEEMRANFNINPLTINIFVWAGICQKCYKRQDSVPQKYAKFQNKEGGVDLLGIILEQISEITPPRTRVSILRACPSCDARLNFYSHRRGEAERNAVFIG